MQRGPVPPALRNSAEPEECRVRNTAIIALLALVVGGLAWWVWSGGDQEDPSADVTGPDSLEDLDFPPYALDASQLHARWESEREGLGEPNEALTSYLDAWHQHNFAIGLSRRDLFDGDVGELSRRLERARQEAAAVRAPAELLAMSWHAHASFTSALDALLAKARESGVPLEDLLDSPVDTVVHAAFEACGDFIEGALDAGVITSNGRLTVPPELVTIMFRHRWMLDFADRVALEAVIPADEQRALARWRIEDAGLALEARLEAIARFDADYGFSEYPPSFARAVAYADAGQLERARMELALGNPVPVHAQ
jgi:hypothetical protein